MSGFCPSYSIVASDPAVKGLVFVRRFLFCWDSVGGEGGTIMVQPEYCPHYMDSYLLRLELSKGIFPH